MGGRNKLILLGGFVFRVGHVPVLGLSCESQRLLAFLALSDGAVSWDRAARTIWAECSYEHAGSSLRSALSHLEGPVRQAVKVTGCDLGLDEGVEVDVRHARSLARRLIDNDALPAKDDISGLAVSRLSEELLPGWYDDWALMAAEDWRQLRRRALEALAARLTDAHRLAEAVAAARVAVQAEPFRESTRAALIRVHLAEGNQCEALEEFERFRLLLLAEAGVEPTPRLHRLVSDLEPR